MAFEIERRFLIKNDNWKKFINKKIYIEQGYLSKSLDGWIIRARVLPTLNLNTQFHEEMPKQ